MKDGEIIERRFIVLRTLRQDEYGALAIATDKSSRAAVLVEKLRVDPSFAAWVCSLNHPLLPRLLTHFSRPDGVTLILEPAEGPTLDEMAVLPADESDVLAVARVCMPLLDYVSQRGPAPMGLNLGPHNLVQTSRGILLRSFGLRAGQLEAVSLGQTLHVLLTGAQATSAPLMAARPDLPARTIALVEGLRSGRSDALSLLHTLVGTPATTGVPGSAWIAAQPQPMRLAPPQEPEAAPLPARPILAGRPSPPPAPASPTPAPAATAPPDPAGRTPLQRKAQPTSRSGKPMLPVRRDSPAPAGASSPAPRLPLLYGRYRQERILGEGGMGAVYLAQDLRRRMPVAVKEMRPPAADAETRARCLRQFGVEASMLNHLDHPSLPRILDFFGEHDRYYLVMEYIEGVTLEDVPAADQPTIIRWASALCDVLEYLHSQTPPVVFRDLKPSNIMLAKDGNLRLIDFGIAHVFNPEGGGDALDGPGSMGYAAPEQYTTGGTDERVDIYALGAVLYYLLVRVDPPSSMDLLISAEDLVPTRLARPEVSERVHAAVEWMMNLSRDQRPGTVAQCRQALGLSGPLTPVEATPQLKMQRLLRQEFHHVFPGPWVPRHDLMAALCEAVKGTDTRTMVLVSGEAGVGKTRLVDELERLVQDEVQFLPRIIGYRTTAHQPAKALLGPMRLLLREDGPRLGQVLADRLDGASLRAMAQTFPELSTWVSVPPGGALLAPLERARVLLKAFREVVEAITETCGRRLVLVLDNAHWLDGASLRLIDSLLAFDPPAGLTVIVTGQPGEPSDDLAEGIQRWSRRTPIAEVSVPPFTPALMEEYLTASLPPVADLEWHLAGLHEVTGGNPLMLEELIRTFVWRGAVEARNGGLVLGAIELVPASIRDSVLYRLEALPSPGPDLLSLASVIGTAFDELLLARLSGFDSVLVRQCLARAQAAVFVRRSVESDWEFVSDAAHSAFYERMTAVERDRLEATLEGLVLPPGGI